MKLWLLSIAAVVNFLGYAEGSCVSTPCTQTDYRAYSNCLSNQCPNTVVATGCPQSKCSSINCNTCSSSNACCNSCCQTSSCQCSDVNCNTCSNTNNACCNSCCQNQCNCQNIDCNSCQGACCQSCCPQQQDCCNNNNNNNKEACCTNNPTNMCCQNPAPQPVIPNITLPNITIFINQTPAIIYNTPHVNLSQTCGSVTTQRNLTHIVVTAGNCPNSSVQDPCCAIPYQPPCAPMPYPPYSQCPPVSYNYACGPQCIMQTPQVIPTQPVIPPVYQPPVYQPPVYQPQIIQPAPVVIPQPPRIQGCYVNYQYNQCPTHCVGGCTYMPSYPSVPSYPQMNCVPINNWPFIRCPYYYGGYGGIGGGYGGIGGGYGGIGGGYGGIGGGYGAIDGGGLMPGPQPLAAR